MGILTVDSRHMQRKHKRVQFDVLVSRTADEPFVSVGQIDGELDGFITIQSLKAEGSQTFANSEGFNNIIRFSVATQSLLDNTSIFNIETIDKGLWYVQFKEVYGTINFVTPFPVSLKITAGIRTGNHKSQSTLIETFFYTTDLDWIKDSRPPAPLLIKPEKLATGNPPHPPSQTIDLSDGITFRLSNPAVKPILQELTLYDIRIYSDAFQQNEVASKLNLTKSQIIDADYIVTSNTQLTGFSNLERGRKYYVRIIAKYLGLESPPLDFAIAFGFTAPSLSDYPTSIVYPTQLSFQVTAQRNTANANNANANQVEFEWRIGVDVQGIVSAVYNNAGQARGIFQIPIGLNSGNTIFVKARSRNSVVIGEWSNEIEISVTLYRPLPIILSFSATTDKVALDAEPTENVFFSLSFSYSDDFGGLARFQILRLDTGELIYSGVQISNTNPYNVPSIQLSSIPSFHIKTVVTYRLLVFNPNGQSVYRDLTITFIPRPSLQYVRWFLNPHRAVYQGVSNTTTPADSVGNPVGSWYSSQGDPTLYVLQENAGNRPTIRELIEGGRRTVFFQGGGGQFLIRPFQNGTSNQTVFNEQSHRAKFTVIMVSDFTTANTVSFGNVCTFKRANYNDFVVFGLENSFSSVGFVVGNLRADEIRFSAAINKFGVICVTYDADSLPNRLKLYYNRLTLDTPFTPDAQSTVAGSLRAVADDGLGINARIYGRDGGEATGLGSASRHIGHIIIFTELLSAQEIVDWSEWLQAIYKFSTA